MEEDKIRNLQVLFNISLPNDWQSLSDIQHLFFQLVIVSPKNLRQRVLLFSDVLPSALFGCKSPCSEVAIIIDLFLNI